MKNVTVVGMGRFGFAMMSHLDKKNDDGLALTFYGNDEATIVYLRDHRTTEYYPELSLSERVEITGDLDKVMANTDLLVLAIGSRALRGFLDEIKDKINKPVVILSLIKALDSETGERMTQIIEKKLAGLPVTSAVLMGGTIDKDLASGQFLGATVACENETLLPDLKKVFDSEELSIDVSTDVIGLQYASAFKNVISIFAGIMAGLGFSYGSETHTISRVAGEFEDLAVELGATHSSFEVRSQCWGNDMFMSATGNTRNRELGIKLGEGFSYSELYEQALQDGKLAEGVNTIAILPVLADLSRYPLLYFIYQLSLGNMRAHQLPKVITDNF